MEKDVLEVVVKNSARDSSIKRIINVKMEPAVPKGENYTSTIFRVTLKVVLANGRITNKTFILKNENFGKEIDKNTKIFHYSNTEYSVYTNILPNMEYLMEEFGDTEGPLWCKIIYYNPAEGIILLEDLKNSGFSTVKRRELQDLDHARLAIRSLGRYHAMAKVLEQRGLISKEGYKPNLMVYDEVFYQAIIYGGMKTLAKGMKAAWGEEWSETAHLLGSLSFEEFSNKMKNCTNFDEDIFKCLNHGDCWNSNMMFRHNWEGKPIDIRFIDYQLPHYNTPCMDLIYYMYTSIKPKVRLQNYESLLKFYHVSLTECLDRFGFTGNKPILEEFERTMERLSFFALGLFAGGYPVDSSESDDGMDIAQVFKTKGEQGFKIDVFKETGIIENMREDLEKLVKIIKAN